MNTHGNLPKEINNPETPLFPIGVVAELLQVTDQTLRVYEKSGIIKPSRRNKDRYYSANDIVWLKCIRRFLKEDGLNLKGIEKLMQFVPCYEISPCEDCVELHSSLQALCSPSETLDTNPKQLRQEQTLTFNRDIELAQVNSLPRRITLHRHPVISLSKSRTLQ